VMCEYVCAHVYVCIRVYVCMCACAHLCVHVFAFVCAHVCVKGEMCEEVEVLIWRVCGCCRRESGSSRMALTRHGL